LIHVRYGRNIAYPGFFQGGYSWIRYLQG